MYETEKLYTIGVQSFYTGSDGEIYSSDLLEFDPGFFEPEAVNEIQADSQSASSIEYYTIDGVKVTEPTSGLFIKVSKMADGTRQVTKVIL